MKKVLIADDDSNLRNTVIGVLESEGFRTLEAANGLSALKAVQTECLDAAILDLNMPKMEDRDIDGNQEDCPLRFPSSS